MWSKEKRKEYMREYHVQEKEVTRFGGNRLNTLKRDNFTCLLCGMTDDEHIDKWGRGITVDHLDNNGRYSEKQNNELNNLATLCLSCHGKKDRYIMVNKNIYDSMVSEIKNKLSLPSSH